MAAQLPDFDILANSMRTAGNGMQDAASELQEMPNVPVINVTAQLNQMEGTMNRMLREMENMRTDLGNMRTDIGNMRTDMDRSDTNNFARLLNSKITSATTPLEPLLSRDGQPIPNFPEKSAQIHDLDSAAVNNLLDALGLPLDGRIEVRKNRFRRYIGLTVL